MAIARMRHSGIQSLKGAGDISPTQLARMFPDQSDWIPRIWNHLRKMQLASSPAGQQFSSKKRKAGQLASNPAGTPARKQMKTTVHSIVELLNYSGPLELLAMECCFAGDAALLKCPVRHSNKTHHS